MCMWAVARKADIHDLYIVSCFLPNGNRIRIRLVVWSVEENLRYFGFRRRPKRREIRRRPLFKYVHFYSFLCITAHNYSIQAYFMYDRHHVLSLFQYSKDGVGLHHWRHPNGFNKNWDEIGKFETLTVIRCKNKFPELKSHRYYRRRRYLDVCEASRLVYRSQCSCGRSRSSVIAQFITALHAGN